jgi:trimeric autotransporter adhesin
MWSNRTIPGGRRPRSGLRAGWALCALLGAVSAGSLEAQTPAGTRIVSSVTATYEASNGTPYTVTDSIVVVVGQVAGVDVDPPRAATANPGTTVVFAHVVTNLGNGPDSMLVAAASRAGWPTRLYVDADGDGALGAGDPPLGGPIALAMGASARLLVAVDVPNTRAVRGVTDSVDVRATSRYDAAVADALVDALAVRDAGIAITLDKSVDRPTANVGDVVTYTITYVATGPGTATEFEITDAVPVGSSYLPGTMRWNGTPLTDAAGDDIAFFDAAGNRLVFQIGDVAGGQSGAVTFQVRVER